MSAGSAGPGRRPRRRRGRRCRRPGRRSRRRRAPPPPRASRRRSGRPSTWPSLALAGHAEASRGQGLEPLVADRLAAALAEAVGAGVHPAEGLLDIAQGVAQAADQGEEVGPLGGGLAGVGEALVQLRVLDALVGARAEVVELLADLAAFGLEPFPQAVNGLVVHPGPPSRFCPAAAVARRSTSRAGVAGYRIGGLLGG